MEAAPCKHYQGMARVQAENGISYLYYVRNGNEGESCKGEGYDYGELLVVEMGSRDKNGERFRSNLLDPSYDMSDTLPPTYDRGTNHYYFNGHQSSRDKMPWPKSWHPGGIQAIGDILVVPFDCHCGGACGILAEQECSDVGDPGFALIDISDPQEPAMIYYKTWDIEVEDGKKINSFASLGVTKNPDTGKYLFVVFQGGSKLLFFESTKDAYVTQKTKLIRLLDLILSGKVIY